MRRGFSLIEVVLVLALVSLCAGYGMFFTMDSYRSHSFYTDRDALVSLLQHARAESMSNTCGNQNCTDGVPHGVAIEPDSYVLFEGDSYALRDVSQDISVERSPLMSATGLTEVIFAVGSANVAADGVIHLSDVSHHESDITVGSEGQISWTH